MDKNDLFREMLGQYMLNKSDELEVDRSTILNRVSFRHLSSDDLYDLIVNDVRQDCTRSIFRSIRVIMDTYLE